MDESLIPSLFPGAQQDESGRWFYPGPDGDMHRISEDNFYEAQQKAANADAAALGVIPIDVSSIQSGLDYYGLTPEQWAASYYGPGQFVAPNEYKKADGTLNPDNPWSFNLGKDDLIGQMMPGLILGAAGLPLAGAFGGGILGGLGAGAIVGGAGSALMGGDPLKGALGGAISGGLGAYLPTAGITNPALSGAIKSGAAALATGGDPLTSAVMGATSGYATSGLSSLANGLSSPYMTYNAGVGAQDPSQIDVSVNPDPYNNIPPMGANGVSFFEDILGNSFDPNATFQTPEGTINPAQIGDSSLIQSSGFNPDSVWQYITNQLDSSGAGFTPDPSVFQTPVGFINPAQIGQPAAAGASVPSGVLAGIAKALLGGGATADQVKRLLTGSGFALNGDNGILGDIFGSRGIVGTGLAMAPTLAAINYAKNTDPIDTAPFQNLAGSIPSSYGFDTSSITSLMDQVPTSFNFDTSPLSGVQSEIPTSYNFDTSKLTDAYNQFDPNSVTGQYDLNTAAARQGLASSLSARGVAGSSFGNSDMTNFGMTRDVGHQQLVNDAITRRAAIANDILTSDRSAAGLNLQGLGLKGQLANSVLDTEKSAASLGLQGLGLRNRMAQSILDNQYKTAGLGLQAQGLKRGIFGDVLNAEVQQQKNKNALYGSALLALSGGLKGNTAPSLFG